MRITVLCINDLQKSAEITGALDPTIIDVIAAESATDALKRLSDDSIDCLLSDVNLPDLDLNHFIDLVRDRHPELPIILFDDQNLPTQLATPVRSAVYDVVSPANLHSLTDRILELNSRNHARKALDDHAIIKDAVLDIAHTVTTAGPDTDIESEIYNRLLVTNRYQFIWIGDYNPQTSQFELHLPNSTVVDETSLTSLLGTSDTGLISRAVTDNTVHATQGTVETRSASSATKSTDIHHSAQSLSTVAVPLGTTGTSATVMLLSSTSSRSIEESERVLLGKLSDIIAVSGDSGGESRIREPVSKFDEFAGKLVHELRNPLGIATAHLEIGQEEHDPDALREVNRALKQIDYTIQKLATMARSDDISNVTPRSLGDSARDAWERTQTAEASLSVEDTIELEADHELLEQLLSNLFRNAVRHGSDDIQITLGTTDTGFFVEDTGPGIPEGDRETVFQHGYSTDNGLGIGLSIVKEIAEAHDWSINVTNATDGGARFEFTTVNATPIE